LEPNSSGIDATTLLMLLSTQHSTLDLDTWLFWKMTAASDSFRTSIDWFAIIDFFE